MNLTTEQLQKKQFKEALLNRFSENCERTGKQLSNEAFLDFIIDNYLIKKSRADAFLIHSMYGRFMNDKAAKTREMVFNLISVKTGFGFSKVRVVIDRLIYNMKNGAL